MDYFLLFFFFMFFSIIGYLLGSVLLGVIIAKRRSINIRSIGSGNVGSTNITRAFGLKIGFLTYSWDCVKSWIAILLAALIYSATKNVFEEKNTFVNNGYIVYVAGFFAVVGHCFPINYVIALFKNKFHFEFCKELKGGKGAATTSGYFMALSPWIFIISFILFWILLGITRYVSVSSVTTIFIASIFTTIPNLNFMYILDLGPALTIVPIGNSIDNFINPKINYQMYQSYIYFNIIFTLLISALVTFMHRVNIEKLKNGIESKLGSNKNKK
ncbi:MAG: glycerol-3-phosphate acyltransferase [Mycoplasmoidaceae bacterium]